LSDQLISFVRDYFGTNEFIPLHAPVFPGREKEYVADTIESTLSPTAHREAETAKAHRG